MLYVSRNIKVGDKDMRKRKKKVTKQLEDIVAKNNQEENKYVKGSIVKKIKKVMLNNNMHIYISALVIVLGYFFYQLGYSFIYGYYFGEKALLGKLLDVMINQIPFDFRLTSIMGAVILLIVACFFVELYLYVTNEKIEIKFCWMLLHIITIAVLYLIISFLIGINNQNCINSILTTLMIASIVLLILLLMMKWFFTFIYNPSLSHVWNAIMIIIDCKVIYNINYFIIQKIKISNVEMNLDNYMLIFFLEIMFFAGLFDYLFFYKNRELRIKKYVYMINTIAILMYCFIIFNKLGKIIIITIIIIIKTRKKTNKVKIIESNSDNKNKKNMDENKGILFIVISIMILILISVYLVLYGIMNILGNAVGKTMQLNSQSKISYYITNKDDNYKVVNGVVVAQSGNTYYISSQNRELIVITSPYVIIEPIG